jgi:hypothetical protein
MSLFAAETSDVDALGPVEFGEKLKLYYNYE